MKSRPETFSVLVAGVGGQGVVLMSRVLARAAQGRFPFVCRTESRGLSQRGGVICSEVRMGARALAPMVGTGREDLLLTTDAMEALRHRRFVLAQGTIVANDECILPLHLTREGGEAHAPAAQQRLKERILQTMLADHRAQMLSASNLVRSVDGVRMLNMIMLGAASVFLPLSFADIQSAVEDESRGASVLANRLAVSLGREAMQKRLAGSPRRVDAVLLG